MKTVVRVESREFPHGVSIAMFFYPQDLPVYEAARLAKLGHAALSEPLEQLRQWVCDKFSVNVLHVVYDTTIEGSPRLRVILDTHDDFDALHKDQFVAKPGVKQSIIRRLKKLLPIVGAPRGSNPKTPGVFFFAFSDEVMALASEQFREVDEQRVIDEFRSCHIWRIDGFRSRNVVFFTTEESRQRNRQNGCENAIKQRCFELVKHYDEFGYCTLQNFHLEFDTEESLNQNCSGSLFAYFR